MKTLKQLKISTAVLLTGLSLASTAALAAGPAVDTYYFGYDALAGQQNLYQYQVTLNSGSNENGSTFDLTPGTPAKAVLSDSVGSPIQFQFNVYSLAGTINPAHVLDTCKATVANGKIVTAQCTSGNPASYDVGASSVADAVYNVNFFNTSNF